MIADDIAFLLSAAIVFVGGHILLSHPLRPIVVGAIGEKGFMALYSVIALISFGWMIHAFGVAEPDAPLWNGGHVALWIVTSVLTLVALALLLGSFARNPALPQPGAAAMAAERQPTGAFQVTRHPMMWGIAIWAISHIVISPNSRTLVFAGAIGFLAIAGSRLQDRKLAIRMGDAWTGWQNRTTYWPRPAGLTHIGWKLWAGALVLWLVITWAHRHVGNVPAGIWRWIG